MSSPPETTEPPKQPWELASEMAGPYVTIQEAIKEGRKTEGGSWKWATNAGNGLRNAYFECNHHDGCGRRMKVSGNLQGFYIYYQGTHSSTLKQKKPFGM